MKRRSSNVSLSPTGKTGKKGVIMEMEEEYSVSGESGDIELRQSSIDARAIKEAEEQMTWREMQAENEALKDQIRTQIAIFEQYLKVAILQQKAIQKEEEKEARKQGIRRPSKSNI